MNKQYQKGEKIHFRTWSELKRGAFKLSTLGYGVIVAGFSDMSDNILTILEVPNDGAGIDRTEHDDN